MKAINFLLFWLAFTSIGFAQQTKTDSLKSVFNDLTKFPDSLLLKELAYNSFPHNFIDFDSIYGIHGILEEYSYDHQDAFFLILSDTNIVSKQNGISLILSYSDNYRPAADFVSHLTDGFCRYLDKKISDQDLLKLLSDTERKRLFEFLGKYNGRYNTFLLEKYYQSNNLSQYHSLLKKLLKHNKTATRKQCRH